MATSSQLRIWWYQYRCKPSKMVEVGFPGVNTTVDLLVASQAVPAWEHFADLMTLHKYFFRESSGGTYVCRKIAGTDDWSLHSYGIAIDLNPKTNKLGSSKNDYPPQFVADVLTLKAEDGNPLFRWGNAFTIKDPMHWEINARPSDIPPYNGEDMPLSETDIAKVAAASASKTLLTLWNEKGIGDAVTPDSISVFQAIVRGYKNTRTSVEVLEDIAEMTDAELAEIATAVTDEIEKRTIL